MIAKTGQKKGTENKKQLPKNLITASLEAKL